MHEFFPEKLRNPARYSRAGAMRQFPTGQLDSTRVPLNLQVCIQLYLAWYLEVDLQAIIHFVILRSFLIVFCRGGKVKNYCILVNSYAL